MFFSTDTYPGCALPSDWSGEDPHQYYVENVIRIDIRNEPFPFINCWISKTDYYNHIDKLNSMLEREIARENSGEMKLEMIQNYAWLMMYVGDFQQVVDRFGTGGPFAGRVNKKDPILKIFPNRDWESFPFVDVTDELGVERWGGTGSVSFIDLDLDGWDELLWERKFVTPQVYKSEQGKSFTAIPDEDLKIPLGSAVIWSPGDVDNDGLPDIFRHCCNYDGVGPTQLVKNGASDLSVPAATCWPMKAIPNGSGVRPPPSSGTGDGTFENVSEKTNFIPLGMMGSDHGDWNNDGYEDLVFGSGGPYMQQAEPFTFYENNGDGTYTNITPFEMLSLFGKGHGAAFTDFNRDGALDLAINNGGAAPGDFWASMVLKNKGTSNNWLRVKLKVTEKDTNSMAVGAKVSLYYGDGRIQVKEIQSGGQFGATNSLVLHYGLGKDTKVDKIVIRWPNRKLTETVVTDITANQEVEVKQNDGSYRTVWSKPVKKGVN